MSKPLTGKELRKLPKGEKKIITFYLTIDEALELNYKCKCIGKTSQDHLRNITLADLKKKK